MTSMNISLHGSLVSTEGDPEAQSSLPTLPPEIWLEILRLASNADSSPPQTDTFDPFPDFPHANIDLWEAGKHEANYRSHHSLRTKHRIVRVCRDWNRWYTPFLYEDILIGRHPCHEMLLRTLHESMISEAALASHSLTLPKPDSTSAKLFETTPPELAQTFGLGRYVRRIAICKDAGRRPAKDFMAYLALIFQCCPSVVSFGACWRKHPPQNFMFAIRGLYSRSLTHLSWQCALSVDSEVANCWVMSPFMKPFQSLQVLDLRCLGSYANTEGQPELRGSVELPLVHRLYIAHSRGNFGLLELFRLPTLNHIVLDITTGGRVYDVSTSWQLIIEGWRDFIRTHGVQLTYIQIVNNTSSNTIYISGLTLATLYLVSLSHSPTPNLTRLEIPLEIMLILESDGESQPLSEYIKPMTGLVMLDLRIATPPPQSNMNPIRYKGVIQSLSSNFPLGATRKVFPALTEVRTVDISWIGLFDTISGLIRPLYEALVELADVRLLDMEGIELKRALLDALSPKALTINGSTK